MHEIFLSAEPIFSVGTFSVTNALILSVVVVLFLLIGSILLQRRIRLVPGGFQSVAEIVYEEGLFLMDSVLGERRKSEKYLPFVATIFLFILFSNWFGILPGVGSIGFYEEVALHGEHHMTFTPLLRAPSSDLNFTLALAILTVVMVNVFGIAAIGVKAHIGKFLNFKSPIGFFIGILELISEIARMISFAFRLFGNVFAGEVLLVVIAFLVPLIAPVPFFFLEIFVGFIQAFVFAMLALVFISMATIEHH
ncbi:MAG: ATP synthase F0 subunit A [Candidatus Ryanbacteria bacterium CG10_big_fil_rev_8_21_14_0_10_43_42]|uniref:ATP synthase subunit a n=1 Tax=Candidatus Ryanbacteria bacterium CG10_big_fil_rev_8_21_14_0_10_43_42 TaxID=1974864 RepID=A0A2M8KX22_9BACT|nr:MAG: ATP synthase F0 subunit A [Candidatus Ryanbacteria bacterium CG10_big_fil_rev_8_21_14_0_10_43_42]